MGGTPENAWAHLRRAKILEHRGKTSDARRALKQALASREPALTDAQRVEAQAMLAGNGTSHEPGGGSPRTVT